MTSNDNRKREQMSYKFKLVKKYIQYKQWAKEMINKTMTYRKKIVVVKTGELSIIAWGYMCNDGVSP